MQSVQQQNIQSLEVILDYKGPKLVGHRMELKEFINSVSGINDLLTIISEDLGLPKDSFIVDIASIENGCLKVKIIPKIIRAGEVIGALASLYNYVLQPGYNYISEIWSNASQFVAAKKNADNTNYFTQNLSNVSTIQARLYQNKYAHSAVEQFSQCLESEVDEIDMISDILPEANIVIKNTDRSSLKITPFIELEPEEQSQRLNMALYLEGVHIAESSKWQFILKNETTGKTTKTFSAEVLASNLLDIGRDQALRKFENKPLYCTVIIKTVKKPGKKRATNEYYVTDCSLEPNNALFSDAE